MGCPSKMRHPFLPKGILKNAFWRENLYIIKEVNLSRTKLHHIKWINVITEVPSITIIAVPQELRVYELKFLAGAKPSDAVFVNNSFLPLGETEKIFPNVMNYDTVVIKKEFRPL